MSEKLIAIDHMTDSKLLYDCVRYEELEVIVFFQLLSVSAILKVKILIPTIHFITRSSFL